MKVSLSLLVVLLVVAKGVVWSALVPLWHFPDEQAHFAQVSYLAELGTHPMYSDQKLSAKKEFDLPEEILLSERLLGTERDNGINKFTYHPEYRIPYTNTVIGLYEEAIRTIPKSARRHYVGFEAANYPPLYYVSMTVPYRLFFSSDLITRVFATRIGNLGYSIVFTLLVLQIAAYLFPKASFYKNAFTLLVCFHPMLTFVFSGISSDNAINLWYAGFILLCLSMLYRALTWKILTIGILLLLIGPFVKQQSLLVYPLYLALLLYCIVRRYSSKKVLIAAASALLSVLLGGIYVLSLNNSARAFLALPLEPQSMQVSSVTSFFIFTIEHTIREVFPWYWGVFNWLGVVLPRLTNRIIIRVVSVAMLGILIFTIRKILKKSFEREDKAYLFLAVLAGWYFMGLTLWDFVFFSAYNYSFGIQGRYYFPTIIAHMGLLALGFRGFLFGMWQRYYPAILLTFTFAMIALNFHTLWVVLTSYYQPWPIDTLLVQVSQYKPLPFKSPFILLWVFMYLALLIAVLRMLLKEYLLLFRQTEASVSRSRI